MRKLLFIVVLLISILTGCSTSQSVNLDNVENTILNDAHTHMQRLEKMELGEIFETEGKLIIEKHDDRFIIYPEALKNTPQTLLIPSNFYAKDEFIVPEVLNEGKLPSKLESYLNQAREIAINYVTSSSIINEADKDACIKELENVTCHYGNFGTYMGEELSNMPMLTNGSSIYVNKAFKNYLSTYTFLHELIHVISNVTNAGSEYELHSYRASKINEAITDIITVELLQAYDISGYEISAYQDYYEFTYYAIDRFNMLETYYYSDKYANIIKEAGQNEFDAFMLLSNYLIEYDTSYVLYRLVDMWM